MRKKNLINDGLGEVINIDKNGKVFEPSTVTLSEELSAEIIEIMNRKEERVNITKRNSNDLQ